MQRIMIVGMPGSGKSTFALKLHKVAGIPLYHLDRYAFVENWVKRNYQEYLTIQKSIVAQQSWIIDGNNKDSLEIRYSRADLCLYFNYPKRLCYYRVFKRLFRKKNEIADLAAGCNQKVRWSLLRYLWNFQQDFSGPIRVLREKYPHVKFMEVKRNQDLPNVEALALLPTHAL